MSGALGSAARSVLLIDDHPEILRAFNRVLRARYAVEVCADPDTALDWIRCGRRYDLILSDLMMPRMSGAHLFSAITQLAPEQAERMFFITGGAFTPAAMEFAAANEDRLLRKPFDPDELIAFVEYALATAAPVTPVALSRETSAARTVSD